jgi:hypothetical protein
MLWLSNQVMSGNDSAALSPDQLAALDHLAQLLEQYQTYLLAGSPFADSARAQASNASGTARPLLERMDGQGREGVSRLEAALKIARTDEDRRAALERVETVLTDLRASIARAHWGSQPRAQDAGASAALSAVSRAPSNARIWVWTTAGVALGLLLAFFGTHFSQSASALSRIWILLQPVIATAAGGILGGLVLQDGVKELKETIRKRWRAMLVCSILLTLTVPQAVDAARELFTGADNTASTSSQPAAPASPAPASTSTSAPAPPIANAPQPSAPPVVSTSPALAPRSSTPPASQPARTAASPAPTPSGAQPALSSAARPSTSAECAKLTERLSLGETLSADEKTFLARNCR